ncbi:phenylacetate-coenzyme A ligase PaaK-like adenylate-forming protein [Nocardiopsis mwathae]|uniref:Phenylacetate-coenzyme A ligase PaaK-like adenylate-forming protein n=1 Tax=Nocardiopsis mwathae TaxID=1472723 RepID=A0A7W9YMF3_9ACTN|nr:AMP-binding protein [Nocardiopsis mwathae]MBB6174834.1 phenylacetate-coenzyme A ligase PaaK-like adenylate-forming protein [Nocardiopsis mwathae]
MALAPDPVLDFPLADPPDPTEFIEAAMRWHFSPRTGSPYWLQRAKTLDFDPIRDVHTFDDLRLFPNVVDEFRHVPTGDLVPKGYEGAATFVGVFESGGTTGTPKRLPFFDEWMARTEDWQELHMEARGHPRGVNWLGVVPTGPHMFGEWTRRMARRRGGVPYLVDLDPRWVKKCIADGRHDEADRYADHLVAQARDVLETQSVGTLITTPPLLERLVRDDRVAKLVNDRVQVVMWGGAHMDADTRHLLRTEVLPDVDVWGNYGSTMILSGTVERAGLADEDLCTFDTFSPHVTFSVVDPGTGKPVAYGERGQVVMNHVSRAMLLPNNLERDTAVRVEPPAGHVGDSVADVAPVAVFGDQPVIEGVY